MAATERLTTLAVGGPAAGQCLTGNYGLAMYHVRQPLNFDYGAPIPDEILTVRREAYREMVLRWRAADGSYDELKFWAHAPSIKDEIGLMKELASGYRPVHQDNTEK